MKKRINIILYVLISVMCSGMFAAGFPAAASDTVLYTLTYDANGGTGAPGAQSGTEVKISTTLPINFPMFFMGWSLSDSSTEAEYQTGDTVPLSADTTIYAVWKAPVEFTTTTVQTETEFAYGNRYTYFKFVPEETGNYIFESTLSSGDTYGILYDEDGKTLKTNDDSGAGNNFLINYRLTAGKTYIFGSRFYRVSNSGEIPVKITRQYDIVYNENGGGEMPDAQRKTFGDTITLSNTVPEREGHTFIGWATVANSTEIKYNPGDTYAEDANLTLYAVWRPYSYTVKYNANGGTSAPEAQTKYFGTDLTLSTDIPKKDGHVFVGWSTDKQASEAEYQAGGTYVLNSDNELFAVWIEQLSVPVITVENVIGGKEVFISSEGSTIYYTVDGTEPDENSNVYASSFVVTSNVTINAIATKEGYADSEKAVSEISVEKAVNPVFSIEEDTIEEGKSLEIYAPGYTIYYTVDGSDPKEKGIIYVEPFIITEDINIKAVAIKEGYAYSDVIEKNVIADKLPAFKLELIEKTDAQIKLAVSAHHNPGISSAFLSLNYPAEALKFAMIENGEIITGGSVNTYEESGVLKILWVNTDNISEDGVLFNVTFTRVADYSSDIIINLLYSEGDIINSTYENIVFKLKDASITVTESSEPVEPPTEAGISISQHNLKIGSSSVSGNVSIDIQCEEDNLFTNVLIAVYDDNNLLSVTSEHLLLKSGKNSLDKEVYAEIFEDIDSATVKIFAWNGLSTMKPVYSYEKITVEK